MSTIISSPFIFLIIFGSMVLGNCEYLALQLYNFKRSDCHLIFGRFSMEDTDSLTLMSYILGC